MSQKLDEKLTVAIIGGSGKMGRWFASLLVKDGMNVIITGRNEGRLLEAGRQLGVEATTGEEAVKRADIVIISVPILSFKDVVKEIAPFTSPRQLIVDVTSVKTMPVDTMHSYIKESTVLGTHPVFGPGAKSPANQNFVLTPTSEKEEAAAARAREYLEARGARVTLMTPGEHDRIMAIILGLSHFIAIVSADTLLSFNRLREMETISGATYKVLVTLVESVISEDPDLYAALQMSLPEMPDIEKSFLTRAKAWADLVRKQDRHGFVEKMKAVRSGFEKDNPNFGKAYENMYRMAERLER